MPDKEKESFWKGKTDAQKPSKGVMSILAGGSNYQPPSSNSGKKEAYDAGYKSEKK